MSDTSKSLFIVDDDTLLSSMLQDYLNNSDLDLTIKTFETGEACVEALSEMPDMVVLDYHLNTQVKDAADGLDILKQLKKLNPSLPVVMLSSQTSYSKAAQTIGSGAVHYVIKGEDSFAEIKGLVEANI